MQIGQGGHGATDGGVGIVSLHVNAFPPALHLSVIFVFPFGKLTTTGDVQDIQVRFYLFLIHLMILLINFDHRTSTKMKKSKSLHTGVSQFTSDINYIIIEDEMLNYTLCLSCLLQVCNDPM